MQRVGSIVIATFLVVAMTAAVALAQAQPSPGRQGAPPAGPPPAEKKTHDVDGTVKKVDPAAKTVQISSGLFGLMGVKVEVADDTRIQVDGKDTTLAKIQEGAKVKASYESQAGRNVAKSIEVKPAEEPAASPSTVPRTRPGAKTQ